MIAVDHLHAAVMDALSSGYCPRNKAIFLMTLFTLVSTFCVFGLAVAGVARFRLRDARFKIVAYIVASMLVLFAIGAGALDLFGFFGCGNHIAEGLTWDWPW